MFEDTSIQADADFPTRIYLTGFMGSGKSTVGPLLALRADYGFLDLDVLVERKAGKSIASLFESDGEAAFRELERVVLMDTLRLDRIVVAVGGGTLTREETLAPVLRGGRLVYLCTPLPQLVRRLYHGRTERPMLLDETGKPLPRQQLREHIERLLASREPFYSRAHHTVHTSSQPVENTVEAVLAALREGGRR